MITTPAFRNSSLFVLATVATLMAGIATAEQPRGSSRAPDTSGYSIAPEGGLPPPEPGDPDLPDDPFGEPPDGSLRGPDFGQEQDVPGKRKRQFHLEMDDN